jgi:hypothetical protein
MYTFTIHDSFRKKKKKNKKKEKEKLEKLYSGNDVGTAERNDTEESKLPRRTKAEMAFKREQEKRVGRKYCKP